FLAAPHRQHFRPTAFKSDGIQARKVCISLAGRSEQNALAVRSPPNRHVCAGMPGQPFGLATSSRHDEDVNVAIVLTSEGDPVSIGRENRQNFVATGCELPGFTPAARHGPKIAAMHEDYARAIDRG